MLDFVVGLVEMALLTSSRDFSCWWMLEGLDGNRAEWVGNQGVYFLIHLFSRGWVIFNTGFAEEETGWVPVLGTRNVRECMVMKISHEEVAFSIYDTTKSMG